MKIGAFTTVFAEAEWLRALVPQLKVFDPIVVVQSMRPMTWLGEGPEPKPQVDEVADICNAHGFHRIVREFTGAQLAIATQRQVGMNWLKEQGCDAAAWFATDELYTVKDASRLRDYMEYRPDWIWRPERTITLWRNPNYQVIYSDVYSGLPIDADVYGHEMGEGFGAAYNYKLPLPQNRVWVARDVFCWHFSFVRPREAMYQKLHGWGLAGAHSKKLYDEWVGWTPYLRVSWPAHPIVNCDRPVPEELIERIQHIPWYA